MIITDDFLALTTVLAGLVTRCLCKITELTANGRSFSKVNIQVVCTGKDVHTANYG